ncbi:ABC transporter ATP-binding protein [Natrarchaeobaculum sulfurireducens]|uniref:Nickel import system ATP-binding protein NikD n=1 Tax=Natrarchaeobaculum sulfurireducens TaxID=2044521 RepID=A0A346PKQ2_9EURY|nr:ABC transporter ATP-binding protein [Natrarchaeobaculum sulfurireducens]AXR76420.1 ABC-type dipeptide/oligopeptide/nickel transportsystem, ATPase component [Natrarchaeobaculum sulfurireducens]AXR80097.1 Dipeptide transport system ATP-binding protein DppD [Natrarchaeobaculum sulfurireducens]
MSEPLLRVENLKTQFFTEAGTVRAVDGISFTVEKGEIVGLVGESGAGKSVASMSLLRLVEDPGEIVAGEITYKGETIFAVEEGPDGELRERDDVLSEEEIRRQIRGNEIAVIFQDPMESLNPVFTVGGQLREFIELNRDLSKDEAREEAIDMLREVGIPDPEQRYDEYPHEFSGGMRQRVLIAMALACEPSLIIADEPTTALDVTVEGQIIELVRDLQEKYGTSFIWVTHDMGVVAEICDRVNVMYLGEIVEQAPVDELFYDTKHPYTQALLNSMPRPDQTAEELEPIEGMMPEAISPPAGCRFHPRCPDAREVCQRVHPDARTVGQAGDYPHRAACVIHDTFDVGYDESVPLETAPQAGTPSPDDAGSGDVPEIREDGGDTHE